MHPKVCPWGKLGKDDKVVNTKSYEQMAAMNEKVERHLRQILSFILLWKFYYPPKSFYFVFSTSKFHFFWKRLHMITNHICVENYLEPAFDDPQSVNRTLTCVWACDNYTSSTIVRYLIVVDGVYYITTTMISSDNDIGVIFCVNCCPTYLTAYDTYLIIKSRAKSRKQWG